MREAKEREQQARERETCLLAMLKAEQQARHDLEVKLLLPPPRRETRTTVDRD